MTKDEIEEKLFELGYFSQMPRKPIRGKLNYVVKGKGPTGHPSNRNVQYFESLRDIEEWLETAKPANPALFSGN